MSVTPLSDGEPWDGPGLRLQDHAAKQRREACAAGLLRVGTSSASARFRPSLHLGVRHGLSVRVSCFLQTPAAKRLFEFYATAAATGFRTDGEFTDGCADSGFTAGAGTPTIRAVGRVGGKAHTPEEFLRIDTLVPRAQACSRAILRLDQTCI